MVLHSSGVQWSAAQCAVVYSGVQWSAVVCSGVQWSAVECSGVQWGAVGWGAVGKCGVQLSRVECSVTLHTGCPLLLFYFFIFFSNF